MLNMVKCSRCGVDVDDSWKICPNCGNDLKESHDTMPQTDETVICPKCGNELNPGEKFCSICGTKIEDEPSNICENCGSEVPENVIFCPTCGSKVAPKEKPSVQICSNCGSELEEDTAFCPECGANIKTGQRNTNNLQTTNQSIPNKGFLDKIKLNSILKPTILALIASVILSSIGLLIGLSWVSYIFAIILSCGFFGGLIDNDANAIVSGLFTGLILGLLENPLVQFWYGRLAAGFYEWFFGGQILLLVILGIVCAYISNMYLKENIQNIVARLKGTL